jgi:hypothetical protein
MGWDGLPQEREIADHFLAADDDAVEGNLASLEQGCGCLRAD